MRDIEKAVRQYKFSPAMSNGKPVSSRIGLSIKIGQSARSGAIREADSSGENKPKLVTGGVVNGKAMPKQYRDRPFCSLRHAPPLAKPNSARPS
jgi:hypothetical protein